MILTIRQSSGMLYDSRVVSDGEGREVAQFRGPSKIALGRMSFGIVDLSGAAEKPGRYDELPWLGWVDPSDGATFRFALVCDPGAGRLVEHGDRSSPSGPWTGTYDIEAGPGLAGRATGTLLLLATALALAWSPPPD